jgi:hypothetical protein
MRIALLTLGLVLCSCGPDVEPRIVPPQPLIYPGTLPPDPADHGVFADVNAERAAIWIEWNSDVEDKTSGYEIYRSEDSAVDDDKVLLGKLIVGRKEPSNDLVQQIDTTHRDTIDVQYGKRYHYQVRAFNRSATNQYTFSKPSPVRHYRLLHPPTPTRPSTNGVEVPAGGLEFSWGYEDQNEGGFFQIVLERVNPPSVIWSSGMIPQFGDVVIERYPKTAPPLLSNILYRWRVKRVTTDGGASSYWQQFSVK